MISLVAGFSLLLTGSGVGDLRLTSFSSLTSFLTSFVAEGSLVLFSSLEADVEDFVSGSSLSSSLSEPCSLSTLDFLAFLTFFDFFLGSLSL